jgi:hypothetical protein
MLFISCRISLLFVPNRKEIQTVTDLFVKVCIVLLKPELPTQTEKTLKTLDFSQKIS